jgi:hypothetical protein
MTTLPASITHLIDLMLYLRRAGFAFAADQSIAFLHGITLMGPRRLDDIRMTARATLAPPPERLAEFDRIFADWAWGVDQIPQSNDDTEQLAAPNGEAGMEVPPPAAPRDGGDIASAAEQLGARDLANGGLLCDRFATSLPRRRSFRSKQAAHPGTFDLRRSLRSMIGADGDIPRPAMRRRQCVQRKLLLLIDISGSMKLHTGDHMKLAHALVQSASDVEVLTFGTRLTHVMPALRIRDRTAALRKLAPMVADWDGGTRIGPSLLAMLKQMRFAAHARGACVIVLSDALERGSSDDLYKAMRRLSLRAHRLSLCTPLAADPRFVPRTAALSRILPLLDDVVDGSTATAVAQFILQLARLPKPAGNFRHQVTR